MDQKSDLIKEDIDQTRSSLTEKLGVLEDTLKDRVESAKETVRQFNPRHQIERHPIAALGGTIAVGYLVGRSLRGKPAYGNERFSAEVEDLGSDIPRTSEYEASWSGASEMRSTPRQFRAENRSSRVPKLVSQFSHAVSDTFGDELDMVKGMALGGLLNIGRNFAKSLAPNLGEHIDRVVDSAMTKVDTKAEDVHEREKSAGTASRPL